MFSISWGQLLNLSSVTFLLYLYLMQKLLYRKVVILKISLKKLKEACAFKCLRSNDPVFHPGCQTRAILCVGLTMLQKLVLVPGPWYHFRYRADITSL